MVRQAGSVSGQTEQVGTGRARKQRLEKTEARKNTLVGLTRRTGNRQTENTGINTHGIMGKMGDTWRGVETIAKTVETDQGVTIISCMDSLCAIIVFNMIFE